LFLSHFSNYCFVYSIHFTRCINSFLIVWMVTMVTWINNQVFIMLRICNYIEMAPQWLLQVTFSVLTFV
jgi:hypothetical protein